MASRASFLSAVVLLATIGGARGADLIATSPDDGTFPDFKCPLDAVNFDLQCNLREAIRYLNPDNDPDSGYDNIRLKSFNSEGDEDFVYYWDQTRAEVVDYALSFSTGFTDRRYAIIEGFNGPDHIEDEEAYFDAGFILVVEGGSVYMEALKFQHFNRVDIPPLSIHSYPGLDTTIAHGGVLATRGGTLHVVACQFFNNTAREGGAIYIAGGDSDNATAYVTIASATDFTSNRATYSGGAIYVDAESSVHVDIGTVRTSVFECSNYYELYEPTTQGLTLIEKDSDCGARFAANYAAYYGGAISIASGNPPTTDMNNEVVINDYCEFSANVAEIDGGAVYMYYTPAVEVSSRVTFTANEATYGGGVYGSRMLTFQIGESCLFESNVASNCGGGMYLNVAGCSNPCDPGLSDSSIRYSSNVAGITQGDCPDVNVIDDGTYGSKNCTYVFGYDCTPTNNDIDTSYFPIEEQDAGLFTLDFQVDYNKYTIDETLALFDWTCAETEPYGDPSTCLTDCSRHATDYACTDEDDQCDSIPCESGATCYDGKNSFTCECAPGFEGIFCETNIPECASSPCQNGATCVDGILDFNCSCTALYEGRLCDTLIDTVFSSAVAPGVNAFVGMVCVLGSMAASTWRYQ